MRERGAGLECEEVGNVVMMICYRSQGSSSPKWYRFDDGEVVEAKIDDEEVCVCMVYV